MRLPDFLIVGAQKAGTTALRTYLGSHPQIAFNTEPAGHGEVHFFDDEQNWARGEAWYRQQFRTPAPLLGEKTPNYLHHRRSIERMAELLPQARIIVSLRNPIDRAYSQWNHFNQLPEAASWGWRIRTFEQALDRYPSLVAGGLYAEQLRTLYTHYPVRQVHVVIQERLRATPAPLLARLLAFLDLAPIPDRAFRTVHARVYAEPMAAATRAQLAARFAPANGQLRALIDDDLPEWD